MISRSLTRRVEHLESCFELVGEPVSEPTIINVQFVDKDLKVVDQMQITIAASPSDAWLANATMAKLPILIITVYIADCLPIRSPADSERVLEGPPAARIATDISP
jgi:hypothetical protein